MRSRQSGVTLVGFVVILIVAAFFAYMALRLVPPYIDYMDVSKAMEQVATEGVDGQSKRDVRRDFMFKLSFQYADDLFKPSDVKFKRVDGATVMSVAYNQHAHFVHNIDFVLHFQKSVQLQGNLAY